MRGEDFVCLSDDGGLKHIDKLLNSKYTAKDMGTLGFEESDVKSLLLLNRTDQTVQYLDTEHAPDGGKSPILKREDATRLRA